ncbi:MAG: site-specific DNA-methyltransferase, partial [Magnetococcales bacterium]|nr:site-specific DNA-methyltransferase [Magnetococcales bacterium]
RFHTDWLNMMYPRLRLARSLLRDDGVIFISIDDNELFNLRVVMNDIFGEENFVASVIWQKVYSPKNSARHFSEDHDYIVVYARNADLWQPNLLPRTEEMEARYGNPDHDPRGPWKPGDLSARNYYGEGTYSIICPSGRIIGGPPSGRYWVISKDKFADLDRDNRIWWGESGNNIPSVKRFLSEVKQGRVPQTLWQYDEVGHTQEAKKTLVELMEFENSASVFETPKPFRLISRMLQLTTDGGTPDIVLDFFAGSGSTAHAVLDLNKKDGGNRRFILVQLPEPTGQRAYPTIAEITKERVRRVIKKLNTEEAGQLDLNGWAKQDRGFRVFKLDTSNLKPWDPAPKDLNRTLLDHVDHILPDRSEQDLLFELLLKLGLELTVPMESRTIAGKTVHAIGGGVVLVCLTETITLRGVEPLAMGMLEWRRELAPEVATTFVFRDSAFGDDVAKTNLVAILEQNLPASELAGIRSL